MVFHFDDGGCEVPNSFPDSAVRQHVLLDEFPAGERMRQAAVSLQFCAEGSRRGAGLKCVPDAVDSPTLARNADVCLDFTDLHTVLHERAMSLHELIQKV